MKIVYLKIPTLNIYTYYVITSAMNGLTNYYVGAIDMIINKAKNELSTRFSVYIINFIMFIAR